MARFPGSDGTDGDAPARFRKDPDPRFWRMNRSLPFDWQLAPYDILQSQAHARGLARIGVMTEAEAEEVVAGLDRVQARIESSRLRLRGGRRGHPHGDRAPARRGDRRTGGQAPHRSLAQRPGRDRHRDGRQCRLAPGDAPLRCGDGAPARPRRDPPRLADARLHPPAARPAGLPRPPSARLLLDALPRRPALRLRRRVGERDAARLGRSRRGQLADQSRDRRRRARLRRDHPELARRHLQP